MKSFPLGESRIEWRKAGRNLPVFLYLRILRHIAEKKTIIMCKIHNKIPEKEVIKT